MILEQVQQVIPKEFNVKGFLNLSELSKDAELYSALAKLKEDVFEDFTRIVFYHSDPLIYTFADLPADSLIQLQKMLVYIDIPNYFCLLVTDNKNISEELIYVNNNHAVNENPINFICLK